MSELIRILIADDHLIVRQGLRSMLVPRHGMEVVGEASDGQEAVEMARALQLSFGVVINRADIGDQETVPYCHANDICILAEIPEDRRIAEASSRGELLCRALAEYETLFATVLDGAVRCVN